MIVQGKVTDETGIPIADVSVTVEGTPIGTITKPDGSFRIPVHELTNVILKFHHLEFRDIFLQIRGGLTEEIEVVMERDTRLLEQVEVIGAKEANVREQVSIMRIDPKTARFLPTPFYEFNKILATMPGVTANNELSATYSVRGGNFDENLVYVNDIPIYRPFLIRAGQQEGLSFVNPDLVNEIEFSSGGWQPKYGDKLSSALNIYYRKPQKTAGSISAGLLGGSVHLETASKNKKISYLVGARHKSAQYLLNTLETKGEYLPRFTDLQSYINFDLSGKNKEPATTELGMLFSYARNRYLVRPQNRETTFGTIDRVLRLYVAFDGSEVMNYDSYQGGIKLSHVFNRKLRSFLIASGLITSETEYLDIEGGYRLCDVNNNPGSSGFNECLSIRGIGTNYTYARNKLQAKIFNVEKRSVWDINFRHRIEFGAGASQEGIDDRIREYTFIDSADYVHINGRLQTDININTYRLTSFLQHSILLPLNQTLTYGLRFNYWSFNNQFLVSPRLQYSIQPNWDRNIVFRAALGLYQQPPFYRELRDFEGRINHDLKAQSSVHAILGMDYDFMMWGRSFKLFTEGYYKYLYNVIPYDIDNVRIRYHANNEAVAYATGIDFRLSGEFIPGAESWFSLGLLTTREDLLNDDQGFIRRPSDQRINLGIFFQDHIPNDPTIRMNLNLLFGSGLPFGPPNNIVLRNSFRGRPYKRVDIGFSKLIPYGPPRENSLLNTLWIGAEILNLLGTNNPISYTWIRDINDYQFGIPNSLSARFFNLKLITNF
ncbi:TonB-dependent receptor [soil metagenome]